MLEKFGDIILQPSILQDVKVCNHLKMPTVAHDMNDLLARFVIKSSPSSINDKVNVIYFSKIYPEFHPSY